MLIARQAFTFSQPHFGDQPSEARFIRWLLCLAAFRTKMTGCLQQFFSRAALSKIQEEALEDTQAATQTAVRDTRVLIVEDESIVALELKMSLRRLGHEVVALAGNGADAIYLAGVHRPDVILMDIRLKGKMDGIDAAAIIRMQWDTPLIFVTGQADEATMLRAQKVSPAAYLNKPIAAAELAETIALVVSRHNQQRQQHSGQEER
jgi:CheY-like chemotaxis protein